jgi:Ribosomal protein L11 methyltransferase (PrmA)
MLSRVSAHPIGWMIVSPFAKVGNFIYTSRQHQINKKNEDEKDEKLKRLASEIFPDRTVLYGPFKGLKYPALESRGSALFPKLLGTYEAELHGILDKICQKHYSEIINIGCGEGYYAVGLALRITKATVTAFDPDEQAQRLAKEMAALNQCHDRVTVHGACTVGCLNSFLFSGNGLVICDCEGAEKDLLLGSYNNLKKCDLLIEVHDFVDITISSTLRGLFSGTHNIQSVLSIDDIHKPRHFNMQEVSSLSLKERFEIFREGRPTIMEWMYLTPKKLLP